MDVQIRDADELSRVSPVMLSAYLNAHNWTREEIWRDRISVWSLIHGDRRFQVLQPLTETTNTYVLRISETIATLSDIEERSQLDVFYELISTGADVIRFGSLNGSASSRLSISESIDRLSCAKQLVTSAARMAERPNQPVHRGRLSGNVSKYLDTVHPLPGHETSEELTLLSPVPADYGEQTDMDGARHRPFPRRALISLHRGLNQASVTVRNVLGGASISSSFEKAAYIGVSANFCDAVSDLVTTQHGIGISLTWAPVMSHDESDARIPFSESSAEILKSGAEWLRQTSPFIDAHVVGEIVRLDRDSQEQFDGRAGVLYELDGKAVVLNVNFSADDREEVIKAFRDGSEISIYGDVYRESGRHVLKNPRNFLVHR